MQGYLIPSYKFAVNSARKFLRNTDSFSYSSQLIPPRVGSETWSLAWGFVLDVYELLRNPMISREFAYDIINREISVVLDTYNNEYKFRLGHPTRYIWAKYFTNNLHAKYENSLRKNILSIYKDILNGLVNISRNFHRSSLFRVRITDVLKLYFLLGKFDLDKYAHALAECLGLALSMLEDLINMLTTIKKKEGRFQLEQEYIWERFSENNIHIIAFLLKARKLAKNLRSDLLRSLIFRLTEIAAKPLLVGKIVPWQNYIARIGRVLSLILPSNELIAYEIGHRLIRFLLNIPQLDPRLFKIAVKTVLVPRKNPL